MSRLEQPFSGIRRGGSSRNRERKPPALSPARARGRGERAPSEGDPSGARSGPLPRFRVGNLLLAGVLLVFGAPLMLLAALAVKITSRGPIIYRQPRIGLDRRAGGSTHLGDRRRSDLGGRPFHIYKFRTMYHRSGPQGRQVWTRPNDRRVTPVGRVLRLFRLDELPQVFNVLRGEMNVIGPRPEQPQIFASLRERFERYPERQRVLPGITGLAQVECGYGGTRAEVERKLTCDLTYVARRSLWLDLRILARTVPVVLSGRGAR